VLARNWTNTELLHVCLTYMSSGTWSDRFYCDTGKQTLSIVRCFFCLSTYLTENTLGHCSSCDWFLCLY